MMVMMVMTDGYVPLPSKIPVSEFERMVSWLMYEAKLDASVLEILYKCDMNEQPPAYVLSSPSSYNSILSLDAYYDAVINNRNITSVNVNASASVSASTDGSVTTRGGGGGGDTAPVLSAAEWLVQYQLAAYKYNKIVSDAIKLLATARSKSAFSGTVDPLSFTEANVGIMNNSERAKNAYAFIRNLVDFGETSGTKDGDESVGFLDVGGIVINRLPMMIRLHKNILESIPPTLRSDIVMANDKVGVKKLRAKLKKLDDPLASRIIENHLEHLEYLDIPYELPNPSSVHNLVETNLPMDHFFKTMIPWDGGIRIANPTHLAYVMVVVMVMCS